MENEVARKSTKWASTVREIGRKVVIFYKLNNDVSGIVSNAASVRAHAQVDVAVNTPIGVPRVTNNPIRSRSSSVISNQLHAMVQQVNLVKKLEFRTLVYTH